MMWRFLPVVTRARPPVGWQRTMLQPTQRTTVCAWLNTVVIFTQLGHLTSMKNELGLWTNRLSLHLRFSSSNDGFNKSLASYTQSAKVHKQKKH